MTQDKDHLAGGSQAARSGSEVGARPTSPGEKHTPGPWDFSPKLSGSENHRGFTVWSCEKSWVLANVIPVDEDGIEGGANARLIASAPDLLAGARHLIAYEEAMDADDHIGAMQHYAEAVDTLRAAIAKATGEPQ